MRIKSVKTIVLINLLIVSLLSCSSNDDVIPDAIDSIEEDQKEVVDETDTIDVDPSIALIEDIIAKGSIDLLNYTGVLYDEEGNIIKEEGTILPYDELFVDASDFVSVWATVYGKGIIVHRSGTLKTIYAIRNKIYFNDNDYLSITLNRDENHVYDITNSSILQLNNFVGTLADETQPDNRKNMYPGYYFENVPVDSYNTVASHSTLPNSVGVKKQFRIKITLSITLHRIAEETVVELEDNVLEKEFEATFVNTFDPSWKSFSIVDLFNSESTPHYINENE